MAAPLLAIGKLLLKQTAKSALKKKAIGAAKNFAKKKAKEKLKDRAKSFISRKKKKGGALVKSKGGALARSVGSTTATAKPTTSKTSSSAIVKGGGTSFVKINSTVENLVNTSEAIKEALARQYANDLAQSKEDRKEAAREKKRKREAILEAGKRGAGLVGGTLGAVSGKFGIMNFLKNVLLGGLLLFLMKNLDKILKAFEMIKNNAYLFFRGITFGFKAFAGAFRLGLKGIGALLKLTFAGPKLVIKGIGKILEGVGNLIGTGLKKLGKAILDFGKNAFKYIFNAAKNGAKIALQNLSKLAGGGVKGGFKAFQMMLQRGRNFLTGKLFDARLAGRTLAKSPLGRAVKGTFGFLGAAGKKLVQGAGPLFKNLAKVAKGIRIPIIGPIIVAVASLMSGDPPTKTLFKAVGTGLGEALGSLIPIPIVGTLLGGLIGEYGGELFYDLFKGKPITGVAKKVRDDFLGGFNKVKDYFSGVWNRMLEKGGDFAGLLNPLNFDSIDKKFMKAFDILKYVVFPPTDVTASGNVLMDKGTGVDNTQTEEAPQTPQSPQTTGSGSATGDLMITNAKTTFYDPSLGGINASGYKTADGLPATSTGEGYKPEVFSAAAFPELLAKLPASMTVPARGFRGGRTLKKPFFLLVTNKDGKSAIIRVNDVGPGVAGHSSNHMLDLSVAAKNYLGTGEGFTIQMAQAGATAGPLSSTARKSQVSTTPQTISRELKAGEAILTNKVAFSDFSRTAAEGGTGRVGKTSGYGMRWGRMHQGIDIGTNGQTGYGVSLKRPGKVTYVGTPDGNSIGAGKAIFIADQDDPSKEYVFMHLARFMVKKGDKYMPGQVIGEIGNTGTAGNPNDIHLHYEVRVNNKNIDPTPYLSMIEIGKISAAQSNTVAEFTTVRRSAPGAGPTAGGRDSETQPGSSGTPSAATVTRDMGGSHGGGVNSYASYEGANGEEVIYIPLPAQQKSQPVIMGGGRSSSGGASTIDVLNSYHKARLKAFLYKQG